MTEQSARTPYLGKYTLVLVGCVVLLIAVNIALSMIGWRAVPSGAGTIIPPMIAALVVGQTWGRDHGALPESSLAWRFAVVAALIFGAVQLIVSMIGLAVIGVGGGAIGLVMGIVVVTSIIVVFLNRWFVTMGAKGVIKKR